MKQLIAAAILAFSLANVSAPYNFPKVAQTAPREDFALIGMYDIKPTRESIQTLHEAERTAAERKAAEKAKVATDSNVGHKAMKVLATAYCGCSECCGKSDHITATGTRATEGRTIAVDPRMIPYGTHVLINGREYVAEDCGGDIQNSRVDVYFEIHDDARAFGRQWVTLEVLR